MQAPYKIAAVTPFMRHNEIAARKNANRRLFAAEEVERLINQWCSRPSAVWIDTPSAAHVGTEIVRIHPNQYEYVRSVCDLPFAVLEEKYKVEIKVAYRQVDIVLWSHERRLQRARHRLKLRAHRSHPVGAV